MIIIGFVHGIGDFHPTDDSKQQLLKDMQARFSAVLKPAKAKVVPLSYENILEKEPVGAMVDLAAKAASAKFAGTPELGSLLADYGTDILQYYLRRDVRATITFSVLSRLVAAVSMEREKVDKIILVGHSLGSLVVLRALNILQAVRAAEGDNVILSDTLMKELAQGYRHRIIADLAQVQSIRAILLASPAFSARLRSVRLATKSLALKESPVAVVAANQVGHGPLVNVYSGSFIRDPLAGPAGNPDIIDIDAGKVLHGNILGHLDALLAPSNSAATALSDPA